MPRRFLKFVPSHPENFQSPWLYKMFGNSLLAKDLWYINRRSIAKACFVGLFCGCLPIPIQMLIAAGMATKVRCHLPVSITLVWISNPITMPAIFYGNYLLGAALLNITPITLHNGLTFELIKQQLSTLWLPLFLGSMTSGLVLGSSAYILIRITWRQLTLQRWRSRSFSPSYP